MGFVEATTPFVLFPPSSNQLSWNQTSFAPCLIRWNQVPATLERQKKATERGSKPRTKRAVQNRSHEYLNVFRSTNFGLKAWGDRTITLYKNI